jgi:flagellar hook-associated protein 2
VTRAFDVGSGGVNRLSSIGFSITDGGHLSFDETKFREAYAEDPEGVEQLFTAEDAGFGDVFDEMLDELTRSNDGMLARRDANLESQEDLLSGRIDNLQSLLDQRQARYERQFAALETSLAALQDQQNALGILQSLAAGSA